jgi:AcrR family transcriptional regulator
MRDTPQSRTRARVIDAYNQLVFAKAPAPIRVGQIVAKAGVGRSTFYDHFANAEAVHMAALSRPLTHLAAPAAGTAGVEHLQWLLEHFWGNRQRARETLSGASRDRIVRLLGEMIGDRIDMLANAPLPKRAATMQIAEAMLSPIRSWIVGDFAAAPAALAASLFETAAAMRAALGLRAKP